MKLTRSAYARVEVNIQYVRAVLYSQLPLRRTRSGP